jgi:hypothetical protein
VAKNNDHHNNQKTAAIEGLSRKIEKKASKFKKYPKIKRRTMTEIQVYRIVR